MIPAVAEHPFGHPHLNDIQGGTVAAPATVLGLVHILVPAERLRPGIDPLIDVVEPRRDEELARCVDRLESASIERLVSAAGQEQAGTCRPCAPTSAKSW